MILLIYVIVAIAILGLGYSAGKASASSTKKELTQAAESNRIWAVTEQRKNAVYTTALVEIRNNPSQASGLVADIAINTANSVKEI